MNSATELHGAPWSSMELFYAKKMHNCGAGLKGPRQISCWQDFSPNKSCLAPDRGAAGGQEAGQDFYFTGPVGLEQDRIFFAGQARLRAGQDFFAVGGPGSAWPGPRLMGQNTSFCNGFLWIFDILGSGEPAGRGVGSDQPRASHDFFRPAPNKTSCPAPSDAARRQVMFFSRPAKNHASKS